MKKVSKILVFATALSLIVLSSGCKTKSPSSSTKNMSTSSMTDVTAKVDKIVGVLPKFAIPMREYGDRYDNMWYAAKGDNWALAAYMEKYMRKAMGPASITKPKEYDTLQSWQKANLDPLKDTIMKKDIAAFDKQYTTTLAACNSCHASSGYPFVVYKKPIKPANEHLDYTVKSNPTDVPK